MARRVFLSYQHRDHGRATGFDLLRRAPNIAVDYSVRHLLKPVDSTDDAYITSKINEQMKGTSVTVVLIGADTASSDWVDKEIRMSLDKQPQNGLLGILIDPGAEIPSALADYAADIIDWTEPADVHRFVSAIEQAALRAGRGQALADSVGVGSKCGR